MKIGFSGNGEQHLSTNIYYDDSKGRLEEVQYGNGGKVAYEYDEFDRVTGIKHDNAATPRFTTEYDAQGRVAKVTDTADGSTIKSQYDLTDRPTESEQRDGNGNLRYRTQITYDVKSRVSSFTEKTATDEHKTEFTYDADNRVTQVRYNDSDSTKVDYTYDNLNRVTNRTVTNGMPYSTAYSYVTGSTANSTTPLIQSITKGSGANALNFSYTYDNRGNITSETRNGVTVTYEYDQIGQLTRVNDSNDKTADDNGTTWLYTYDRGGNILSKAAYEYTTGAVGTAIRIWPYVYGDSNWKDKLTSFDGHNIIYDAIGNPLNDGTWTYEWQAGRQLRSMSNAASGVTMEFTYNHAGLRTKKVKKVNGIVAETTAYIWNGKQVVTLIKGNDTMHFYYDAQGKVCMVDYNGDMYTYVHNMQGDVVGIADTDGILATEYKYDAWGKTLGNSPTLVTELNPFRYRGYIYDAESGIYYLVTRFYSPHCLRFINSDTFLAHNSFIYCDNSPVTQYDKSGQESESVPSCNEAIDVTNQLTKAMAEHYAELRDYRKNHSLISTFIYFIDKVKTGGEWDLKDNKDWNLSDSETYTYAGITLRRDEIGNIHYGFVGSAFLDSTTLHAGAGIYQLLGGPFDIKYLLTGLDDSFDYYAIEYGYRLAEYCFNQNPKTQANLDSYVVMWKVWKQ